MQTRILRYLLLLTASISLSIPTVAQVPDPTIAAMAPIGGAGHDYIGFGSETVNPADGSFTFNLPLNLPSGRQVNLPFGLRYAPYEQYYLGTNGISGDLNWRLVPSAPFQFYGWAYLLPSYSAQAYTESSTPNPSGNGTYVYCDGTKNYVLRIADVQDTFNVQYLWPDVNNTAPSCNVQGPQPGFPNGNISFAPTAGSFPAGTHPAMQAVDPSGTTYNFPSYFLNYGGSSNETMSWGLLATTITDKNGNQIKYTGSQYSQFGNGSGGAQLPTPAGGYKDTLGRQVVSWSGLGSSLGDQVSISGLSSNVAVKWKSVNISFPETGYMVSGSAGNSTCTLMYTGTQQIQGVSEIDLPNGQKYTFGYDRTYGTVNKITFPDGGYVRYVWGSYASSSATQAQWIQQYTSAAEYCYFVYDTPAITDRYVSFDGSSEILHQHFAYTPVTWIVSSGGIPYWNTKQTTVQTIDARTGLSSYVVYNYVPEYSSKLSGVPQGPPVENSILYQDAKQNTLKTLNKTWYNPFRLVGEQTILDNGQGEATLRCWSGTVVVGLYEYGFQQEGAKPADPSCPTIPFSSNGTTLSAGLTTSAIGPLRRQTAMVYHTFASSPSPTEPDSVTVYDGSGNELQQTTYAYDASSLVSSGTKTGLVAAPGSRGNATSVSRWLNTSNSYLTTSYTYYDNGNVHTKVDACGNTTCSDMTGSKHTTTYTYTDSYSSGTPPGQTNAYVTKIADPLSHQSTFTYSYGDGHVTSATDANTQPTYYKYNTPPANCSYPDGLDRLSEIDFPDQGKTTYCYNDTVLSPSVTTTKLINSNVSSAATAVRDGMEHVVQSQLTSDPEGTDTIVTTYDGEGRVYTVSNPYRSASESTYGVTQYGYDALGRLTQVTHPDGNSSVTTYKGRAVEVQDEGNGVSKVSRILQTDGLGHLVSVCEVTNAAQFGGGSPAACKQDIPTTGFITNYTYDALDNLQTVQQGSRLRSFSHDSLSRLQSAMNPESGTTSYTYDSNSNVSTRIRPAPNQTNPATTLTTTYKYDVLNRLTSTAYSDSVTPTITRHYDTTLELGRGLNNTIGRLSAEFVTSRSGSLISGKLFGYDPLGRVNDNSQCTPSGCASSTAAAITYGYDLLGDLQSATNGEGTTFNYSYDGAARLTTLSSTLSDANHPATLFSNGTYSPIGSLAGASLGAALNEAFAYDCRGRILGYASVVFPTNPSLSIPNTSGCSNSTATNRRVGGDIFFPSVTRNLIARDLMLPPIGTISIKPLDPARLVNPFAVGEVKR